jgi:hypothetical protein
MYTAAAIKAECKARIAIIAVAEADAVTTSYDDEDHSNTYTFSDGSSIEVGAKVRFFDDWFTEI